MKEQLSVIEQSKARIRELSRNEAGERIQEKIAEFQRKKREAAGETIECPKARYHRLKNMLILKPTINQGVTLYSAPIGPGIDSSKTIVLRGVNTPAKKILADVSRMTGVPRKDIISPRKDVKTVAARTLLMYRLATLKKWRQPEIARFVNRDHSTVIYGVRTYCDKFNLPMPQGWKRRNDGATGR